MCTAGPMLYTRKKTTVKQACPSHAKLSAWCCCCVPLSGNSTYLQHCSCANQAAAPVTRGKLGHYQLPCHWLVLLYDKPSRPCLRKSRQPRCACVVVRRSAYKLSRAKLLSGDRAAMLTVVRLLHKRGFRHNHLPVLVVRQKLEVGIRNPALQCKLPILSYGVEVWDVKSSLGEAAEMLFEDFVGDSEVHIK